MKWRCPICGEPTDSERGEDFPFCSERCRVSDLGAWATGQYRISEPLLESDAANMRLREPEEDDDER